MIEFYLLTGLKKDPWDFNVYTMYYTCWKIRNYNDDDEFVGECGGVI